MHVPSVKHVLPKHAPYSSMQKRGTRGATKGLCRGEQIEIPKKAHGKSFLRKEVLSWKGSKLDGARGQKWGLAYSSPDL